MTALEDDRMYDVVVNDEEQYSVWAQGRDIPAGWYVTGFSGTRDSCLDHIAVIWTDMRPASLRQHLQQAGEQRNGGAGQGS